MHFDFSLVIDRDLLKDTHRWHQIHVRSRQQTCFSFFMPHKSFNKPLQFLLYKTNRLHFSVCVYCNRSRKTSQRVKNNSRTTRLRLVSYFLSFTRYAVICDLLQYTHTRKNVIYLLNIQLIPLLHCIAYFNHSLTTASERKINNGRHFCCIMRNVFLLSDKLCANIPEVNFADLETIPRTAIWLRNKYNINKKSNNTYLLETLFNNSENF